MKQREPEAEEPGITATGCGLLGLLLIALVLGLGAAVGVVAGLAALLGVW